MGYIAKQATEMRQKAEAARQQRYAQALRKTEIATPLHERLRTLLRRFDPADLSAGLELHTIRERLDGKKTGRAHCGELGDAFRRLGWVRKRCWRADLGGFRSRWYPPTQD